jgi:hypothetical protein
LGNIEKTKTHDRLSGLTCSRLASLHTSKYGANTGENAEFAKIEYGIRVRLIFQGFGVAKGQSLHDLVVTAPVLFLPPNSNPDIFEGRLRVMKHPETLTLQTSALTEQTKSSTGFRQSMRDRFSSGIPTLEFEIAVQMPELMIAAQNLASEPLSTCCQSPTT